MCNHVLTFFYFFSIFSIFQRRGGKFCIIWLAAHEQLKLQGRGSRNDLRQALTLNMNRTLLVNNFIDSFIVHGTQ